MVSTLAYCRFRVNAIEGVQVHDVAFGAGVHKELEQT